MKSLRKLRGFAAHRVEHTEQGHRPAPLDELAQACQDMKDMRSCYDSLLSAAAATANSAYEFSEALREMGTCLLEKTAQLEDEESGRALLMLGKVQFELEKLVDGYRSHIVQTITTPSESLLNELRIVEEMKRQSDDKKEVFDFMLATHKERSKSKDSKGESFSPQLQAAQQEYDDEATLFVFRLKSLKQGQSRSLLTQAARHHAAQLNFFRKGNMSLEAIEPLVKLIAEKQHIDYQFSGLEDDGIEEHYGYDASDDGELSFDYGQKEQGQEVVSTSRNPMELDQTDQGLTLASALDTTLENIDKSQQDPNHSIKGSKHRPGSQSAPIFPDKEFESVGKLEMQSSSRKLHTYVLPTPLNRKGSNLTSSPLVPVARQSANRWPTQSWQSSPLRPDKKTEGQMLFPLGSLKTQSVPKGSSDFNCDTSKIPPPLAGGLSLPKVNPDRASDTKKIKRHAFSGPLLSKPLSSKPYLSMTQEGTPTVSAHVPLTKSSTSPKVSNTTISPFTSTPKISELHELPRPPLSSGKHGRPLSLIGHSAPLLAKRPEHSGAIKALSISSRTASPLPMPPSMGRSFSIPASSPRTAAARVGPPFDPHMTDEVASPPLTPISLMSLRPESKAMETDQSTKSKDAGS